MTKIKTRYDTSGGWSSANPVLLAGERGEESNTGKAKVGDGTTAWNSLGYVSAPFQDAALTGNPTAPTQTAGNNSTRIATTQFVQATLAAKADLASPAFTGAPTAPTPGGADDSTALATTEFVRDIVAAAVAPIQAAVLLAAHPVSSIFISVSPTNPGTIFGGTWIAWGTGRVPVGVDAGQTEFDTVEETGGAKTTTIVAANLPPHAHDIGHNHSNPSSSTVGTGAFITRGTSGGSLGNIGATNAFSGDSGNGPGTSTPMNNLPPYITCYMWKRVS